MTSKLSINYRKLSSQGRCLQWFLLFGRPLMSVAAEEELQDAEQNRRGWHKRGIIAHNTCLLIGPAVASEQTGFLK